MVKHEEDGRAFMNSRFWLAPTPGQISSPHEWLDPPQDRTRGSSKNSCAAAPGHIKRLGLNHEWQH